MVITLQNGNSRRLPEWLRKKIISTPEIHNFKKRLREVKIHTVCEEAKCPNICECFRRGTATIMIMGKECTRDCSFCAVSNEKPAHLDPEEPERAGRLVADLNLSHAVITSVTRDDLPDGGASHFADTLAAIRFHSPKTTVEILTPDFNGQKSHIATVCEAKPDIFNHNLETVERLTPTIRNLADYGRSLNVLKMAGSFLKGSYLKSGLMLGLGEYFEEVERALLDLHEAGCQILTLGQYLQPNKGAIPVHDYIRPETFREYEILADKIGFKYVFSGPFVRSSYLADKVLLELKGRRG